MTTKEFTFLWDNVLLHYAVVDGELFFFDREAWYPSTLTLQELSHHKNFTPFEARLKAVLQSFGYLP